MLATRRTEEDLDSLRVPLFVIVRGVFICSMGGHRQIVPFGETISYKKHGSFQLEYGGDSYGIVHHVTSWGKEVKIFIHPGKGMSISNGKFKIFDLCYDSYREYYKQETF